MFPQEDEVLKIAMPLIIEFEGLKLTPYLCSAGVPTIGYGSTQYANGIKVSLSDPPISKEYALDLFEFTLKTTYLPAVRKLCPTLEKSTQAAAILSWTYNLGTGALASSTMRQKILKEAWSEVPVEILKWNKAKGKVIQGLVRRRIKESLIFQT